MTARKIRSAGLAVIAVLVAEAAAAPVPIGLAGLPRSGSDEDQQIAKELGLNFVHETASWDEPKEGDYPWTDSTDDPFASRLQELKKQGYCVCVTFKTVDDEKKRLPLYLEGHPFDDPQLLRRWTAFLKAFLARYGDWIDFLNLGQKVNGYFVKHDQEWRAFVKFVAAGSYTVRQERPKVSVGVVLKDSDDPARFWRDVAPACTHLALAYTAPCSVLKKQPTALALSPNQPVYFCKTFEALLKQAGGRKLLLTEVGCPTHPSLDSSPEVQAQFITALFAWLRQAEGHVAAVSYVADKDLPYEATRSALRQMFGDGILEYRGFIRMLTSLGLRDEQGNRKPAFEAFKKAIREYRGRR